MWALTLKRGLTPHPIYPYELSGSSAALPPTEQGGAGGSCAMIRTWCVGCEYSLGCLALMILVRSEAGEQPRVSFCLFLFSSLNRGS